jgi:hypothetical protein
MATEGRRSAPGILGGPMRSWLPTLDLLFDESLIEHAAGG